MRSSVHHNKKTQSAHRGPLVLISSRMNNGHGVFSDLSAQLRRRNQFGFECSLS